MAANYGGGGTLPLIPTPQRYVPTPKNKLWLSCFVILLVTTDGCRYVCRRVCRRASRNYLILIIAGASADASADESSDKFLKKPVFFTLFLVFLNSRPIQSLSKARSDPYWEEQSLQKINQSNTVFKQLLNSFFCHSLNCFDSFKYSSPPACIFRV